MLGRIMLLGVALTLWGSEAAVAAQTPVFAALPVGWPSRMKPAEGGRGFGQVRPTTIYGGAESICHIDWISWGNRLAVGVGVGSGVSETTYRRYPTRVVVVLGGLGMWHGKRAYTRFTTVPAPGGTKSSPRRRAGLTACEA